MTDKNVFLNSANRGKCKQYENPRETLENNRYIWYNVYVMTEYSNIAAEKNNAMKKMYLTAAHSNSNQPCT